MSQWTTRIAWGLAGLTWFAWLGIEDPGLVMPTVVAGAILLATALSARDRLQRRREFHWTLLIGPLAGALVPALSGALVIWKASLHGHSPPFIPPEELWAFLRRTPLWALAGGMLAGSLALLSRASPED